MPCWCGDRVWTQIQKETWCSGHRRWCAVVGQRMCTRCRRSYQGINQSDLIPRVWRMARLIIIDLCRNRWALPLPSGQVKSRAGRPLACWPPHRFRSSVLDFVRYRYRCYIREILHSDPCKKKILSCTSYHLIKSWLKSSVQIFIFIFLFFILTCYMTWLSLGQIPLRPSHTLRSLPIYSTIH